MTPTEKALAAVEDRLRALGFTDRTIQKRRKANRALIEATMKPEASK